MNRLFRLAVRLYPSWWRQRYAREFEALLEDVKPGWREWFNVISGALTMQIKTLGAIPVVCALAGAIVGGIVALRTPAVFASSATIWLNGRDSANTESATGQELRVSLEKALRASGGTRKATLVAVNRDDAARITMLKLTYLDREPAQAQRVAEQLTAAIIAQNSGRAASIEVLDAPDLPGSPIRPDYPMTVASGGGVGLVAGGMVLLLLRSRRRPATAG
jgi:hypothetical protein